MLKKLPILLGIVIIFNVPLTAQHTHIELSYQSLRPFIHFQLNINSYRQSYDTYESVYMQGYMDGVNVKYYYGPRFVNVAQNIRAYKAGYQDGFQDRALLIRLRGRRWYVRHQFAYNDYYAPHYAVQIWLEGLSLAFLRAPERRLPHGWKHRAHPHLKNYRKWMSSRSHNRNHNNYYSSNNVERRYKKRIHGYRQKLNKAKKRRHHSMANDRNRMDRKRFGPRHQSKSSHNSRINRHQNHRERTVKKRADHKRKKVKNHKRRVRKKSNRHSNKSKRQRNRRGNKEHGNNN